MPAKISSPEIVYEKEVRKMKKYATCLFLQPHYPSCVTLGISCSLFFDPATFLIVPAAFLPFLLLYFVILLRREV
jgi:hypothetical protein